MTEQGSELCVYWGSCSSDADSIKNEPYVIISENVSVSSFYAVSDYIHVCLCVHVRVLQGKEPGSDFVVLTCPPLLVTQSVTRSRPTARG